MIHDLRHIIDGWEYEPGKISVRKIIGRDGREKVQTRVDLGLLQFEITGRPDGRRPFGFESLKEYFEARLREHIERTGDDEGFQLGPEECHDLRQETHLYYQRYLSLFVLEEYDEVTRDTMRNLHVMDFCRRYAAEDADRQALETQRAYVMMMNLRARAYAAMRECRFEAALALVQNGLSAVAEVCQADGVDGDSDRRQELRVLYALRDEILDSMPDNAPSKLRWELQLALSVEDYERAAEIRNRLTARAPTRS